MDDLKAEKEIMSNGASASNMQLRWSNEKDRPAIEAVRELGKALGENDGIEALRWLCENAKEYAIEKAKKMKEFLKAS